MFDPTREQVRDLFFGAWRKYRAGEPLAGIESLALDVILLHPEYHGVLSLPAKFREKDYSDEEILFMRAMDQYKRANRRPFPTWSEVLEVLHALGYRRTEAPTALPGNQPAGVPPKG